MANNSERPQPLGFFESASRRISFWGLVIVGFTAIFSASFSSRDLVGIGICLVASALAFTALRCLFISSRPSADESATPPKPDDQGKAE